MTSNAQAPVRPAPLPPQRAPYPHLKDLVARTNSLRPKDRASIKSWLEIAKAHWHQAKWRKETGSLDSAYVDYLMAFTIVASTIPNCPEYPTFRGSGTALCEDYDNLAKTLRHRAPEFEKIKEAIREDNESSGIQSTVDQLATPDIKVGNNEEISQNEGKKAPEVLAKPGYLVYRPVPPRSNQENGSSAVSVDLQARFQRLSTSRNPRPLSTPANGLPASLVAGVVGAHARHPQGPREMPTKSLQLSAKNSLPQMPAPTYSPSKSYGSPGGLSPPRSSTRVTKPKLPPPSDLTLTAEMLSNYLKSESVISVLLLDIRPREKHDQGYIHSRATICIEPIVLREGMSGDDLEQSLVLAPAKEYELFKARSQYDLVVYYDQSTPNTNYLDLPTNPGSKALRSLYAALHEFGFRNPLRRPPLLLAGGLDAWIGIFSIQSLKVGETMRAASPPMPNIYRRSREVARAPTPLVLGHRADHPQAPPYPTASHNSGILSMPMPVEPIDIEEEKKWLEQLQREKDPVTISVSTSGSEDGKKRRRGTSIVGNAGGSHVRTVEEYFQQYPASPHAQESMMIPRFPDTPLSPRRSAHTIIDHPFHVFTDVRNPDFNPPASPVRPPPVAPRKSYSGVSERLAASTPMIPERPPKLALPLRSISGTANFSIGNTGLKNLGNTCYMNAILQCMSGTIPLSRYFLDGSYKTHINKDNPLGSRGVLAESFATIIKHLWSGEYSFISPLMFKNVSGRLNETFRSDSQQDAQEFLAFLLDGLHEDLNPNATKHKLNSLTDEEERRRERLPVQVVSSIEWQRYVHQNSSVIVNWLQGQLNSRLTCLTCGITSTTYSPFMYLSLPIPVVNGHFTLRDCLREFTKEEVLDGDDCWHCPSCKQPRKATKKLTITRLPHILIIHLKRFTNQGRWRDKLNTPINFPLVDLDLTEHVPPVLLSEKDNQMTLEQPPETTPPFIYDLYGIANHYGTLHGGHYTAFVKNSYKSTWNSFDDSKATNIDESRVVSRNAYVLFWVRKHVM